MPIHPKPTPSELAILRTLWEHGPSTVRQVHERLSPERSTGYTTTLKLIQIMTEKGLVTRSELGRQHVYRARHSRQVTEKRLVRDLVDRAFDGSTGRLVLQALATRPASPAELRAIRELIDEQQTQDSRTRRADPDTGEDDDA